MSSRIEVDECSTLVPSFHQSRQNKRDDETGEDGVAGNGNKAAFWPRNHPTKCWHEIRTRKSLCLEVLRAAVAHDQPSQYNYMIYTSVGMEGPAKFQRARAYNSRWKAIFARFAEAVAGLAEHPSLAGCPRPQ
jgi:hypothetical protein